MLDHERLDCVALSITIQTMAADEVDDDSIDEGQLNEYKEELESLENFPVRQRSNLTSK